MYRIEIYCNILYRDSSDMYHIARPLPIHSPDNYTHFLSYQALEYFIW